MRLTPPLAALAAGAFGIGTTEFVIMGLLPNVAHDLRVSIPTAGLIVTGYATGVVVGAPLLAVLTAGLPRKPTLVGLMALFTLGNLLCALAPSYGLLMAARVLTAFAHAAFFGIGAVVAGTLVPERQRAQAMALMFAGLTLANVLGVPGGTAFGQAFGWRASFGAVAGIGAAAALSLVWFLPGAIPHRNDGILREFRVLGNPSVVLGMAMSAVSAAALFAVFTYITPLLETVTGLPPHGVTLALVLYGVGLTAGNVLGGRLADWNPLRAIAILFAVLVLVVAAFTLAAHAPVPAIFTMVVWGVVAFACVAPLQYRVISLSHAAPNLASTLNQGAFNVGCASGAFLGGLPLDRGMGYTAIPWVSVVLLLLGLGLTGLSALSDRRTGVPATRPATAPERLDTLAA